MSSDMSSRTQQIVSTLAEAGLLDAFLDGKILTQEEISSVGLGKLIQERDLRILRSTLLQYGQSVRSLSSLSATARTVKACFSGHIIYLPTYRRIEQDITELLSLSPMMMRRVQSEIQETLNSANPGTVEIVRFGMEDIESLLADYTQTIKEYSRQQINSLATAYLNAALKNRQHFEKDFFNSLSDNRIKDVLSRVDDRELDTSQRKGITDLIKSLRKREGYGRLTKNQEHIAGYFPMLAETHDRISGREEPLNKLAKILNGYLGPDKRAEYDPVKYVFTVKVGDTKIPLSGLSSGEKQLMSLFATLALNDSRKLLVVIDEPELSLSVLWQENLLSDIMSIENCANVIAVTHSPFIYGEKLSSFTRDLSDFSHPSATALLQ